MPEPRLFTFGCSFTEYRWPTWADIWGLGGQFGGGYWNMAAKGSSNERIAYHINEFVIRFGSMLTESDVVAVMWTGLMRQCTHTERHSDGSKHPGWRSRGSYIHSDWVDDANFIQRLGNEERFMIRDYNLIHFADQVLCNTQAKIHHFQMINVCDFSDSEGISPVTTTHEFRSEINELFGGVLSKIKPSMHENVFSGDWNKLLDHNKPERNNRIDPHALPSEHMQYLSQVIPDEFDIRPQIQNEVYYLTNRIISNNNTYSVEENYNKQYFSDILPLVRDYPGDLL